MLELLLTADGALDPHYTNTLDSSVQQPLSILQKHLSYEANAGLTGALLQWAKASGVSAVRLLRLTCRYPYTLIATLVIICVYPLLTARNKVLLKGY